MTPVYEATASILVVNLAPVDRPGVPGTEQGTLSEILISDRLMKTYVELVDRPVILGLVSQRISGALTAEELAEKISVANRPLDTQILQITVKDSSPERAALIANATAQAFIAENEREIGRPGTVSVSQAASAPRAPIAPRIGMYTAFATFLGFVVGAMYARGLDYLDDTIKTPEDITRVLNLPTLGVIGRGTASSLDRALGRLSGRAVLSPFIEDVRELRTRVLFMSLESDVRTLAVVSERPNEGSTLAAASLAEVMAEAGEHVVLVDANLRKPSLHEMYGIPNTLGLTGFLMQKDSGVIPLESTRIKNLRVLPAGPTPSSPADLLASREMTRMLQQLKETGCYVIFDTLPLASGSDALILAGRVDGTLPIVQARRARAQGLTQSVDRLRQARANILGIVLNNAKPQRGGRLGKSAISEGALSQLLTGLSQQHGRREFRSGSDVTSVPADGSGSGSPEAQERA
jgi:capsular exopolysaccharide synthesis family protein